MWLAGKTTARGIGRLGAAACVLCSLLRVGVAHADVGSERRPVALYTLGPTAELSLGGGWRFGGEAGLSQYVGPWGYGAAFGAATGGRMYAELQAAWVLGGRHNVVVGFNPGLVIDTTGVTPRYGAQGTLWLNYALQERRREPWASPLIPFGRIQEVPGMGLSISFGLTLKLAMTAS